MFPRGAGNIGRTELESLTSARLAPKCFLPNAVFKQVDGSYITASQMRRSGGEILLGPNNSHVRVLETRRHAEEERYFLKICTAKSMLEVTQDHRVITQSLSGSPKTLAAGDVAPLILTGAGPQPVQSINVECKRSEVVEPIFEEDAAVLVWTRSGRRSTNTEPEHAFAVRGGLCDVYSLLEIKHGFFNGIRLPSNPSMPRSRSADSNLTSDDQRRLARTRLRLSRPPAAPL